MHGIIRQIAIAVGVVTVTLAVAALVIMAVEAARHFAPHSMEKFLNFLLSHIRATSTQMHAVLFAVLTFIFISLRMVAGFSLTTLARRGRSILVPTILLFGITFHLLKAALDF